MPLYNRLKEYRAKIKVNQTEMGNLVGVSRQTISQIERGDYSPSVTLALKIAKVLNVSVEEILSLLYILLNDYITAYNSLLTIFFVIMTIILVIINYMV